MVLFVVILLSCTLLLFHTGPLLLHWGTKRQLSSRLYRVCLWQIFPDSLVDLQRGGGRRNNGDAREVGLRERGKWKEELGRRKGKGKWRGKIIVFSFYWSDLRLWFLHTSAASPSIFTHTHVLSVLSANKHSMQWPEKMRCLIIWTCWNVMLGS